jgi:multicomponent Na+:H+ antiporter subunit D
MDVATTSAGLLLPSAVMLPFAGMMFALVCGGRSVPRIAALTIAAGLGIAVAITAAAARAAAPIVYILGGFAPPLGIALRADAPAIAMLLAVAVVVAGIGLYARRDFAAPRGAPEARAPTTYWLLLLAVWGSLNLVFVSGDLFTLYVALELLTFAGVPLVCLGGEGETLRAALRYLVYALAGSILYLLGVVLIFGETGTLDIALVAQRLAATPPTVIAVAAMTAGLLAKTALFPLHLWLPPAHAGAPPAASAVLSALVVKGSWFIVVRLWFDVAPALPGFAAAQVLGALGATAIVAGNVLALRQQRLKLLVAYSTVAQIGYLFMMFPLALDPATGMLVRGDALTAGVLQATAHASAKAAMFMAAGTIYATLGHDRIAEFAGAARAAPVAVLTFALGGLALMGIVPSGAYVAKKLLLDAAGTTGQWWWSAVMQAGGTLTCAYVVLVLARAFGGTRGPIVAKRPRDACQDAAMLSLALLSFVLAFATLGPLPDGLLASAVSPKGIGAALAIVAAGALLAAVLGRRRDEAGPAGAARRAGVALGTAFERSDALLRQWPVAALSLIVVALAFGAAMHAGA